MTHELPHRLEPAPTGLAGSGGDELIDRIKWATLARVVLLTAVLGFAVAMDIGMGPQPAARVPETTLYQLTSAFYFQSFFVLVATQLLRNNRRGLRLLAVASIAIDALLALSLVAVTDGLHSVFLFAFPLSVLNSALLLYRTGAMASATGAALGLLTMGGLELGWLPLDMHRYRVAWLRTTVTQPQLTPLDVAVTLLVQTAAVYGTALLASHLLVELAKARSRSHHEQRELASLRVRFDDVVTSMPDGILTVSAAGLVTSANPAALQVLGMQSEEVVSQPLAEVLPPLVPLHAAEELEVVRLQPDGRTQVLAFRTVALRDAPSEVPSGVLLVFRDLTEERAREERHRRGHRADCRGGGARNPQSFGVDLGRGADARDVRRVGRHRQEADGNRGARDPPVVQLDR